MTTKDKNKGKELPPVKKLKPAGPHSRRQPLVKHKTLGKVYVQPKLGQGAMTNKRWEEMSDEEQQNFLEKDRATFREEAELERKEKLETERLAKLEEERQEKISRQALQEKTISIPYDVQPHTPASKARAKRLAKEAKHKAKTQQLIDNYYAKHPDLERRKPQEYVPGVPGAPVGPLPRPSLKK